MQLQQIIYMKKSQVWKNVFTPHIVYIVDNIHGLYFIIFGYQQHEY